MQIDALFGELAARVLLYLHAFEEGHAPALAAFYGASLSGIQKQLQRLEAGGVLVSRLIGTVRLYTWSPRLYGKEELRALLERAFQGLSEREQERYHVERKRPRRAGKPLDTAHGHPDPRPARRRARGSGMPGPRRSPD